MKAVLHVALAGTALVLATPASADIIPVPSSQQGTLVHNPGPATEGATVTANLGAGGPNIVNFNGDTTGPGDLFRLQQGQGQAEITAALNTTTNASNDTYNILSGNIFLTGNAGMDYIEFALRGWATPAAEPSISRSPTTAAQSGISPTCCWAMATPTSDSTRSMARQLQTYSSAAPPGAIESIRQARIIPAVNGAIPEPGTWAMMLLVFAGAGIAICRSRRRGGQLLQLA